MRDEYIHSQMLDRVDFVGAVRKVLAKRGASLPEAVIHDIADLMRETCQSVFRGAVIGVRRSFDKNLALGTIQVAE